MSCTSTVIGVDIGRKRDPTAICVAELDERGLESVQHFLIRHLQRLPLGTSFPEIAQRLSEVASGTKQKAGQEATVYVNATGLGQPIIDRLREATNGVCPIRAVYFTHGDQWSQEGGTIRLGKACLVSRLQILLQDGRLHLPHTTEAERLAQELLDYEIQIDEDANDRYGAFRVGTHDDLVTALGLAVQDLSPRLIGSYSLVTVRS